MRSYNIIRPSSLLLQGKHVVLLDIVEIFSMVVITRYRLLHRNVNRAPDGLHNAFQISSCRDVQGEWVRKIIPFRQFANTCSADAAKSRRSSRGSSGTEGCFLSFSARESSTWTYSRDFILSVDAYLKLWAEQLNTVFAPGYHRPSPPSLSQCGTVPTTVRARRPRGCRHLGIFFEYNIGGALPTTPAIVNGPTGRKSFTYSSLRVAVQWFAKCLPSGDAGRWAR